MKYLAVPLVILVIAGSIWFRVSAPCWMWNLSAAKDIPGRCIMEGK